MFSSDKRRKLQVYLRSFVVPCMSSILPVVLVWVWVELVLFMVAGMGLCFAFVLNTGLVTQG